MSTAAEGKCRDAADLRREKKVLWEMTRLSCYYNNESLPSAGEVIGGNATDRALMSYILGRQTLPNGYTVTSRIPFDSARKWAAAEIAAGSDADAGLLRGIYGPGVRRVTLIKGAPEKLLGACDRYIDNKGSLRKLDSGMLLRAAWSEMTGHAMRVLALAVSETPVSEQGGFSRLVLVGLVGIRDEVRPGSAQRHLPGAPGRDPGGDDDGDNRETAAAIARSAGLLEANSPAEAVMTSSELENLTDGEVKARLPALRVVARAMPADKSRLVRLAQEMGLVAGMTGDGINDAPALKLADVGFSMGSGTEVAKEAGDIVILDDNFASIAKAVLYGRTIFKSIRKFIIFQLTMNLCAVGVSIIGPFIGIDTPVTVIQMLWINIIMDTLAGLAFAGEPPLQEYMKRAAQTAGRTRPQQVYAQPDPLYGAVHHRAVGGVSQAGLGKAAVPLRLRSDLPDDGVFRPVYFHRYLQQLQRPHPSCQPVRPHPPQPRLRRDHGDGGGHPARPDLLRGQPLPHSRADSQRAAPRPGDGLPGGARRRPAQAFPPAEPSEGKFIGPLRGHRKPRHYKERPRLTGALFWYVRA